MSRWWDPTAPGLASAAPGDLHYSVRAGHAGTGHGNRPRGFTRSWLPGREPITLTPLTWDDSAGSAAYGNRSGQRPAAGGRVVA
ncbi:hypothetical protein Ae263Ps1_0604 [Pseudonocardia sp. Ae263_Ps1]|nr:hypothetical protein Ae150APs1_4714c [Pseudonocardia sp. Ae150A_Ps1]OLL83549.1 hypothetical protein Ae263Ps1_0604 [Pseudonocardia sp. Ae263_Ps1]OLL90412.1 hypothetical protein Ae356Ps1_0309c [Pseudonocardia sp. Ae356_Ps1]